MSFWRNALLIAALALGLAIIAGTIAGFKLAMIVAITSAAGAAGQYVYDKVA